MQGGSRCERGSDSVSFACFYTGQSDTMTQGWAPQSKTGTRGRLDRLSTSISGFAFFFFTIKLPIGYSKTCQNDLWLYLLCHCSLFAVSARGAESGQILCCVVLWVGCVCLMRGCGSKVRCWRQGNTLTLTQVHFPWVCGFPHESCSCKCSQTRQLQHFQRGDCKLSDQTHISSIMQREKWSCSGTTLS